VSTWIGFPINNPTLSLMADHNNKNDLHCTLVFLADTNLAGEKLDLLRSSLLDWVDNYTFPFEAELLPLEKWHGRIIVVPLKVPDWLQRARQVLVELFKSYDIPVDPTYEWSPHITLRRDGMFPIDPRGIIEITTAFLKCDDQWTYYPLGDQGNQDVINGNRSRV